MTPRSPTAPAATRSLPSSPAPTRTTATNTSGSETATVSPEGATLTYTGDYFDLDTTTPTLSIQVDQRNPANDTEYIDYSKSTVWARFDIYTGASTTPSQTLWRQVANAPNWGTTGYGIATAKLSSPLSDGSYTSHRESRGVQFSHKWATQPIPGWRRRGQHTHVLTLHRVVCHRRRLHRS
jgi:hypothetical protein